MLLGKVANYFRRQATYLRAGAVPLEAWSSLDCLGPGIDEYLSSAECAACAAEAITASMRDWVLECEVFGRSVHAGLPEDWCVGAWEGPRVSAHDQRSRLLDATEEIETRGDLVQVLDDLIDPLVIQLVQLPADGAQLPCVDLELLVPSE